MTTSSRFIASKVRSNRPGWSVTFRHPLRTDSKNQKGLKIRKGLGTSDDQAADQLVHQLNELLGNESWWNADKRTDASHLFDPVVVSAFFDGIEVGSFDSASKREQLVPLPSQEDGYGRILLLGTTGAGKTTLLRHLIGSDHEEDRFPSTSTAKTTTADTEIITSAGDFEAAITFMPEHQVRAYIDECLEAACVEAVQRSSDAKIVAALLHHEEQRFRLSYLLGGWAVAKRTNEDEFSFEDEPDDTIQIDEDEVVGSEEQKANHERLEAYLSSIKSIAANVESRVANDLGGLKPDLSADDRAAWLEIFGSEVFSDASFAELALDILEDVAKRFDLISDGLERAGSRLAD